MTCPLHTAPQTWCGICGDRRTHRETCDGCDACRSPWEQLAYETVAPLANGTNRHDAQVARIAGLEANVNEKLATIAALESQLASESRLVLSARISALATALRKSLADVDPKAMSTYEQQQARREARALLEEVA